MDAADTVKCPLCKGEKTRIVALANGVKEERRCFLCNGSGKTLWKTAVAFQRWRRTAKSIRKRLSSRPAKPAREPD